MYLLVFVFAAARSLILVHEKQSARRRNLAHPRQDNGPEVADKEMWQELQSLEPGASCRNPALTH